MTTNLDLSGLTVGILMIFGIWLVCSLIHYRFKKRKSKVAPIQHLPEADLEPFPNNTNDIEIEDPIGFTNQIVSKYSSYKDFIQSKDFDEYFQYFYKHPKILADIKEKIEHKPSSFFKYKSVKY